MVPADLGEAGPNPALAGLEVTVARVPMNHPHAPARREDSVLKLAFHFGGQ